MNINYHMNIFTKNNNKFSKCKHNPSISEKEIETFLEKHPYILEDNLVIIGSQVNVKPYGIIDLLGLDSENNLVIIEIKKDMADHEAVGQIFKYSVWADACDFTNFIKLSNKSKLKIPPKLSKIIKKKIDDETIKFNAYPRFYIVAERINENVIKIVDKFSAKNYDNIECIEIQFYDDKRKILLNKLFPIQKPSSNNNNVSKYQNIDKSVLNLFNKIKKIIGSWDGVVIYDDVIHYTPFKCGKRNFLAVHLRKRKLIAHIISRDINDPKKLLKAHNKNKFKGRIWEMTVNGSNINDLIFFTKQAYESICK